VADFGSSREQIEGTLEGVEHTKRSVNAVFGAECAGLVDVGLTLGRQTIAATHRASSSEPASVT
jgi:hypothetical protein